MYRMYDIIMKKRNGAEHTADEIRFIVEGFTKGEIPDYQMSAWLMCVYYKGMTHDETCALTHAMAESGDQLSLAAIHGVKVDKHSTGGVGDKTTFIVAPILASLGVPVAKMSGRGLGHTGGTIDKLEAIPGFCVSIPETEFIEHVNSMKLALVGQTGDLAPADKKIYALRDVTATVDSLPLIASSIMSKKLAAGADAIVLDVKCGSGAFMKNETDAKQTENTNFALLVAKHFSEPFKDSNGYGESIARLSNMLGGGVIVQRFGDLIRGRRSTQSRIDEAFITPTLSATPGDLSLVLPKRILDGIIEMIYALDKIAPGTANEDTLLYGVEVKFYNMEVDVDEKLETRHKGLYIIGDGSGITHSLSHASASGVYVARNITDFVK